MKGLTKPCIYLFFVLSIIDNFFSETARWFFQKTLRCGVSIGNNESTRVLINFIENSFSLKMGKVCQTWSGPVCLFHEFSYLDSADFLHQGREAHVFNWEIGLKRTKIGFKFAFFSFSLNQMCTFSW